MKHLKTIFSVLMVIAAVSCAKTQTSGGQVSFEVSSNQVVVDVTKSNVSDYTALPSAADFTIAITGADYEWTGRISEWNASTVLLAGEYSVTASYGSIDDEGFDKPYFTGTSTFVIKGGEETSVSIPVSLGNTVVRMTFSESFTNYYPEYAFKLTRNGSEIVAFAKGEAKAAFVDGWKFTLEGTLVGEMKTTTISKDYNNLDPATAYTFSFDVTNVGGATLTIKFNDTVETIDLGDHELND